MGKKIWLQDDDLNCGIYSCDKRTVIEAVHACLTGRGYPDGCSETRKRKNSKSYVSVYVHGVHEILKGPMNG